MLIARNLWFAYPGQKPVIQGVSLQAAPGQLLVVMGPTGSGKTTLLLLLAGLLKPDKGQVLVDGLDPAKPEARRRIGLLFQNPDDQLFNPTVYDDIAYALRTLGLDEHEVEERVRNIAERLGITSILERQPHQLSHGQKKLAALATILVYSPRYLLLDEPLAFLDPDTAHKITCIIAEQKQKGHGIIAVIHAPDPLLALADQACILRNSRLHCTNPHTVIETLREHPITQLNPLYNRRPQNKCTKPEEQ